MNKNSRAMKILELSLKRNHPPTAELLANHLQRSLRDSLDVSIASDISVPGADASFGDCSDLFPTIPGTRDAQITQLLPISLPAQAPNHFATTLSQNLAVEYNGPSIFQVYPQTSTTQPCSSPALYPQASLIPSVSSSSGSLRPASNQQALPIPQASVPHGLPIQPSPFPQSSPIHPLSAPQALPMPIPPASYPQASSTPPVSFPQGVPIPPPLSLQASPIHPPSSPRASPIPPASCPQGLPIKPALIPHPSPIQPPLSPLTLPIPIQPVSYPQASSTPPVSFPQGLPIPPPLFLQASPIHPSSSPRASSIPPASCSQGLPIKPALFPQASPVHPPLSQQTLPKSFPAASYPQASSTPPVSFPQGLPIPPPLFLQASPIHPPSSPQALPMSIPSTSSPQASPNLLASSLQASSIPPTSYSQASPIPPALFPQASSPLSSPPPLSSPQPASPPPALSQELTETDTSLKRKRKGRENWKQTKNIKKRESGEQYVGRTLNKETGKYIQITKERKSLGARCTCKSVKKNKCHKITDVQREDIFNDVWQMTWSEKKVFVRTVIDVMTPVERKSLSETRQYTFFHHLNVSGQRFRVCKQMFLNTTGLKETWVRMALTKVTPRFSEVPTETVSSSEQSQVNVRRQSLAEFINSIPKLPSHYRRKQSKKNYLEPVFQNFAEFYKEYLAFCKSKGCQHVGRTVFMEEVRRQNIDIFKPRNDRCDYCISYENGLIGEQSFTAHREKELRARAAMQEDTDIAKTSDRQLVITMDLQAVLQCPKLNASALYYKTKLCVHNFTLFDNVKKDTMCYVWHETEGGLSANEFASCVVDYLEERKDEFDSCVIFSDGCTYQNRNKIMAKALSYFSQKYNKTVTQKVLEKGHTQMPVDSVHSVIERKLKNKPIYCPSDYVRYIREARQHPKPYAATYLGFQFFKDFSGVSSLTSVRPGQRTGEANVTDIRQMQYRPTGEILYKLDFQANTEWLPIPMKRNESTLVIQEPSQLYVGRLKIKTTKYNDLQSLKAVLPIDYHAFYDNLPC